MNLIELLIIIPLAVHQATNIMRYSSLFAPMRARLEVGDLPDRIPVWAKEKITELLLCPWCTSVHLGWILTLAYWSPIVVSNGFLMVLYPFAFLARLFVLALALSQVANLIHHLTGHRGTKA
jgi:hypothetical protein